jgi:hypothetical protein
MVVHTTQGEGPLTDNPLEISDATSEGTEDWAEGDDLPVGMLVILDTDEVAIVSKTHAEIQHLHEPMVKVISDSKGGPLEAAVKVDLAESDRTIVRTTDAQKYGIRVSDYLVCL